MTRFLSRWGLRPQTSGPSGAATVPALEEGGPLNPRVGVLLLFLGACARSPVVADVRCPRDTHVVAVTAAAGHCALPNGDLHGPGWRETREGGVEVTGYEHGKPAGPWARYDASGAVQARGVRPGASESLLVAPSVSEAAFDSPETTGRLVVPSRVRLFPVGGDITFAASTLVSTSDGHVTSSFLGAGIDIETPAPARLRFREDAYRAFFLSYGVQGAVGSITRANCDDPALPGSGGFCGSRWLVGAFVRVGHVRTRDASPRGALASFLAYGRLGFLLGEDRWSSLYSTGSAVVWRARVGAGYTAFGGLLDLAKNQNWLLIPVLALVEHLEAYVELGGDGGSALGAGGGVDVGFGL